MTATVTQLTIALATASAYEFPSTILDVMIVLLLIILLIQRELVRASGGPRLETWMQTLNIAIIPLSIAFVLITVTRFVDLLHPG